MEGVGGISEVSGRGMENKAKKKVSFAAEMKKKTIPDKEAIRKETLKPRSFIGSMPPGSDILLLAGGVLLGTGILSAAFSNPVGWVAIGAAVFSIAVGFTLAYVSHQQFARDQTRDLFEKIEEKNPAFQNMRTKDVETVKNEAKSSIEKFRKEKNVPEIQVDDAEKLRKEAIELLKKREYEEAMGRFAALIKEDDGLIGSSPVWFDFCRAVHKAGDTEKALELLLYGFMVHKDGAKEARYRIDATPVVQEILKEIHLEPKP